MSLESIALARHGRSGHVQALYDGGALVSSQPCLGLPVRAVHADRPSRRTTAPSFGQPPPTRGAKKEYSSTRTAVVRSPWLVRPSGTHSVTTCAIQNSASPDSVAYLRRICFSITRCTERI